MESIQAPYTDNWEPDLRTAGKKGFIVWLKIYDETNPGSEYIPFQYRYRRDPTLTYSEWFTADTKATPPRLVDNPYRITIIKENIVPSCDPCSGTYYFDFREIDESGQPIAMVGTPFVARAIPFKYFTDF